MKKTLLGLLLLVATGSAFSQETKFGLKAGVNFANLSFSGDGESVSPSSLTSFHFQGYADFPVSPALSIQPGLGLSGKGAKEDEAKINLMYLDIPVNAVAKFPVSTLGKFFIGAGPYAGIKLSEKYSLDGEEAETEEDSFKSADFGLNFLGGLEINNGLTFNVGYGLGLANVVKDSPDGYSVKNKVFTISVGFLF
ncbi:porin family protein [Pararcticibacter amylolyticus]|uniref:Outer membrane protein beta-barrel domain-containing protein n=1 Tax=Pararcticibacter amylolyticus TaxID=2173175 RepID=A0A2U2PHZ1_9SPHI|nr:porin family protein [Pararcticibacter amylolyticus]PWG81015.1 hypothetical protein DDR33_08785 [Pararcticibacter amylolyticus]